MAEFGRTYEMLQPFKTILSNVGNNLVYKKTHPAVDGQLSKWWPMMKSLCLFLCVLVGKVGRLVSRCLLKFWVLRLSWPSKPWPNWSTWMRGSLSSGSGSLCSHLSVEGSGISLSAVTHTVMNLDVVLEIIAGCLCHILQTTGLLRVVAFCFDTVWCPSSALSVPLKTET